MIIFGGSISRNLAEQVSQRLHATLGLIESRQFPDGEHYIRVLSEVQNEACILIETTNSNDSLVELLLLMDTLHDLNARTTHTIMPYMGYSRQDKRFRGGEAFSAKTILQLVDHFSDSITTINCHFLESAGEFKFEGVNIRNLDACPLVAEYFKNRVDYPVIISPDKGAVEYVKKAAKILNCEFDYLEKTRVSDQQVTINTKKMDVSGRNVLILDDMISTGGTIIEAARFIKSQGARSVRAGCVHGVFSKGIHIFDGVLDELVCTDTIPREVSKISVSKLIAETISKDL